MNPEMIAELFAKIGFKVDASGIHKAKAALSGLEKQIALTARAMDKNLNKAFSGGKTQSLAAATKAQAAQMHSAQLQGAKLQQIQAGTAATGLKTQQQQVKLHIEQQKLAQATAATQAQAAKAQLQQQGQVIANNLKQLSITNSIANAQQKAQAHSLRQAIQQHRLARMQAGTSGRNYSAPSGARLGGGLIGFGASSVNRLSSMGSLAGSLSGGGFQSALGGLAANAGGAATALGSILGPAALVVAAFGAVEAAAYGFAREAERSSNTRTARLGQFESVGDKTPENAQRMNNRFENFSQTEGLSTKDIGTDYAKLVGALSSRIGVDRAADTTEGIMRFGNSQHLSNDTMQRLSTGLRQVLGKGQLYSEEWTGQIAEHLGPMANQYGAEAWQRASGGNLTGEAAEKAFAKDRQDRKIAGDASVRFLTELGAILDSHSNDGGLGDSARMTQSAWNNRINNQYQTNMANAYDMSGLHDTMASDGGVYDNFVKLLHELQPEFLALGQASNFLMTGLSGVIKSFTDGVKWFNSDEAMFNASSNMGQLVQSLGQLGDSLTSLWHIVSDNFGEGSSGPLKLLGDSLAYVGNGVMNMITHIIDAITVFIQALTQMGRGFQDVQHQLPEWAGGMSDDRYNKILEQRKVDDAKYDEDRRRRIATNPAAQSDYVAPAPYIAPSFPTAQRNPDVPVVPQVMASPPQTNPVQPAVSGKSVTNNNTTNIEFNAGTTHITTGLDASEMQRALSKQADDWARQMTGMIAPLMPPTDGYQHRGN